MQKSIGLLCAGGSVMSINKVISTVLKLLLKDGYKIIGVHDGYKNLFNGNAETQMNEQPF